MNIFTYSDHCPSDIENILLRLKQLYPDISVTRGENRDTIIDVLYQSVFSLIIIDTDLPGEEIRLLIEVIRTYSDAILLIITSESDDLEHMRWMYTGADDVITRPYHPEKLVAKCIALLRRTKFFGSIETGGPCNNMVINLDNKTVVVRGQRIHLTPIEFSLLSELTRNIGYIVPLDTLIEKVWGQSYRGEYNLLKAYIYRLRNKLSALDEREKVIKNERGTGYICGI